ncbi:MAG: response regulator [Oscillospiraceae bacterium]|nr:response regulator [Oscillospiraceae bacterium]
MNENKKTLENLLDSDLRLNLMVKSMRVGMWDMVVEQGTPILDNNSFWYSQEVRHMLGFNDETDFPNVISSWSDRLHPEDKERTLTAFETHLSDYTGSSPYDVEYRLKLKNGDYRHFRAFGETLRDSAGMPLRVAGALEDIHEKKIMNQALEMRSKIVNALNESNEIFCLHDGQTFNETMTKGIYPLADAIGMDRVSVYRFREKNDEKFFQMIYLWERATGGTSPIEEKYAILSDVSDINDWTEMLMKGEYIDKRIGDLSDDETAFLNKYGVKAIFIFPIFTYGKLWGAVTLQNKGKSIYSIKGSTEINLLRSAAQIFADAIISTDMLERAKAASRAKGDFLSTMSHEMRTPMNSIIGMTAIGKRATSIEEKNYALKKIEGASSHLLGVINDVLDMAKIEANKLELSISEYNFEKMLHNVISIINFRAEEKQQNLTLNIHDNIPRFLIGDYQRITQVITNLLSNAIKFTPEGGEISLNIYLDEEIDGLCKLRIEIIDNGIGISPEQQERLFTAFEQGKSGMNRDYGGTGLGLVISKRIVELMDGKIWVDSKLGKGSKFIFTILTRCGGKSIESLLAPGVNKDNVRILVVDDMVETRQQFLDLFGQLNIDCDAAQNGIEACEIIDRAGEYDIYFVDWRMPGMDGVELTRRIKSKIGRRPSVVTMITAADWEQIRDEALSAGVDKYLLKPLFSSMIIDCVNECIGADNRQNADLENTMDEFNGKRMLLAEDVEINREILTVLLKDTGITIDCAENGKDALDMIEKNPHKYDIIFMDVQMPKMNGIEATKRIRTLPALSGSNLPIVAMTANIFKNEIEECLAAGMNDHLGKPLDIEKVLETLRKYLGK